MNAATHHGRSAAEAEDRHHRQQPEHVAGQDLGQAGGEHGRRRSSGRERARSQATPSAAAPTNSRAEDRPRQQRERPDDLGEQGAVVVGVDRPGQGLVEAALPGDVVGVGVPADAVLNAHHHGVDRQVGRQHQERVAREPAADGHAGHTQTVSDGGPFGPDSRARSSLTTYLLAMAGPRARRDPRLRRHRPSGDRGRAIPLRGHRLRGVVPAVPGPADARPAGSARPRRCSGRVEQRHVVYQALLLAGYAWAHVLSRFSLVRQVTMHVALLVGACLWLPIGLASMRPPTGTSVVLFVPLLLVVSVGPVLFAVSAQAPLLQQWYVSSSWGRNPYALYAPPTSGASPDCSPTRSWSSRTAPRPPAGGGPVCTSASSCS